MRVFVTYFRRPTVEFRFRIFVDDAYLAAVVVVAAVAAAVQMAPPMGGAVVVVAVVVRALLVVASGAAAAEGRRLLRVSRSLLEALQALFLSLSAAGVSKSFGKRIIVDF